MGSCSSIPAASDPIVPTNSKSRDGFPTKSSAVAADMKTPIATTSYWTTQASRSSTSGVHSHQKAPPCSETEECEDSYGNVSPRYDHTPHSAISFPENCETIEDSRKDSSSSSPQSSESSSSTAHEHSGHGGAPSSTSSRHLADIKHSISVEGDLCKGVVHIEVSVVELFGAEIVGRLFACVQYYETL